MKFFVTRVFEGLFTLFVIATLTFFLLKQLPGSPFDEELALPPEMKAQLEKHYHLDRPIMEQYALYLGNVARWNWGTSFYEIDRPVSSIITESLKATLVLGLLTLIVSYTLGIFLGLVSASHHLSFLDRLIQVLTVGGISLPQFLVGPLLVLVFSFWLDLLPPALWDGPKYWILPVLTLSIRPTALIARIIRVSTLDVSQSDFVRTAQAKGVSQGRIFFHHILRNSLVPLLSISAPIVAGILSGSFIVEMIFAVPGIGQYMVDSVLNRDFPVVMALTILFSAMLIVAHILADWLMMILDPRMKIS